MTNKGDLISRKALKKAIMYKDNVNSETWEQLYDSVLAEIDNAPTVEPNQLTQDIIDKVNVNIGLAQPIKDERPQGKWIELREYDNKCSICGQSMMDKWDYCPNCGAEMRKGGAE